MAEEAGVEGGVAVVVKSGGIGTSSSASSELSPLASPSMPASKQERITMAVGAYLASIRMFLFGLAQSGSALLLLLESSSGSVSSVARNKSEEIQSSLLPFPRCELCGQIVSDGEHR